MTNPVFGQEISDFVGCVLAIIVRAKASEVFARLVLCSRPEALEGFKDVALSGKGFNAKHARVFESTSVYTSPRSWLFDNAIAGTATGKRAQDDTHCTGEPLRSLG